MSDFKTVWYTDVEEESLRINYEIWYKGSLHLNCYLLVDKEMPPELLWEACEYLEDFAMTEMTPENTLPI